MGFQKQGEKLAQNLNPAQQMYICPAHLSRQLLMSTQSYVTISQL